MPADPSTSPSLRSGSGRDDKLMKGIAPGQVETTILFKEHKRQYLADQGLGFLQVAHPQLSET